MNYPDFKYVDVAVNGAHNRNRLCDVNKLGDPIGKRDTYMTYFRYPEDMLQHFKNTKSVKGYHGPAYTDWIPIDIDSNNINEAQDEAQRIMEFLNDQGIDINACRFYFSGSKGFHILIPSRMAEIQPSEDIHLRIRHMMKQIGNVDTSIYDKIRIFRLPNTINTKSGLYKVELYPFELNLQSKRILELAWEPREELEIEEEYDTNEFLKGLYDSYQQKEVKVFTGTTEGVKAKICMKKMMEGVSEGNRDNVGLRVVTHLRQSGLSKNMIWAALTEWNQSNQPSLEQEELGRIFNQGLQQYDFGCRDSIMQMYCDKSCVLWKEEYTLNNVSRRIV